MTVPPVGSKWRWKDATKRRLIGSYEVVEQEDDWRRAGLVAVVNIGDGKMGNGQKKRVLLPEDEFDTKLERMDADWRADCPVCGAGIDGFEAKPHGQGQRFVAWIKAKCVKGHQFKVQEMRPRHPERGGGLEWRGIDDRGEDDE